MPCSLALAAGLVIHLHAPHVHMSGSHNFGELRPLGSAALQLAAPGKAICSAASFHAECFASMQ